MVRSERLPTPGLCAPRREEHSKLFPRKHLSNESRTGSALRDSSAGSEGDRAQREYGDYQYLTLSLEPQARHGMTVRSGQAPAQRLAFA